MKTHSATEWTECICGADIKKVESFTGETTTWVGRDAGPYCYPDDPDSGRTPHEPLDWNIR